jgi:site-specific DNA-methyltransferase (adenine-specific)
MAWTIHHGDCREVMATLDAESVDAIVCDPPYGLSFMGKGWDHGVPGVEFWTEALRVAKPGAHLLAFGGTRTYHRLACAIEDAGWEIRDCVMWVYGSGFPKSHDVSKAIDKAAGADREVTGATRRGAQVQSTGRYGAWGDGITPTAPATDAVRQWSGWGTALKPAWEPIMVARKPLVGTVAENVLRHGTGGINVDGCRVGMSHADRKKIDSATWVGRNNYQDGKEVYGDYATDGTDQQMQSHPAGRWPANLIHDGSEEVVGLFPSNVKGGTWNRTAGARHFNNDGEPTDYQTSGSDGTTGSAARFFYCAKASRSDRGDDNKHPTVKPTALMRYLCRLVTPPGGIVLDPFTGSGSTGKGAVLEGFQFIGIEREAEYVEIAKARIAAVESGPGPLFEAG